MLAIFADTKLAVKIFADVVIFAVDTYTLVPENAPPVKFAAFTHPAAAETPVPAVIVVPLMVDPWKLPPLKAAPVNPVPAVIVVPLTVVPATISPVVFTVLPENAPPVKFAAFTHPATVETPVPAVMVVPLTVDPWKLPPLNAVPVKPVDAVIVVPLTVVPATIAPVVFTVLPENAPPVKFAAFTHPAAVETPVPAVIVVPLMVDP
jgi:hypothetical protein